MMERDKGRCGRFRREGRCPEKSLAFLVTGCLLRVATFTDEAQKAIAAACVGVNARVVVETQGLSAEHLERHLQVESEALGADWNRVMEVLAEKREQTH